MVVLLVNSCCEQDDHVVCHRNSSTNKIGYALHMYMYMMYVHDVVYTQFYSLLLLLEELEKGPPRSILSKEEQALKPVMQPSLI